MLAIDAPLVRASLLANHALKARAGGGGTGYTLSKPARAIHGRLSCCSRQQTVLKGCTRYLLLPNAE